MSNLNLRSRNTLKSLPWSSIGVPPMQYVLTERVNSLHEISEAHHEESSSLQCRFTKDVMNLADVIRECSNIFMETSQDLFTLCTHDVMEKDVVMSMANEEESSRAFHASIIHIRTDMASVPIANTI